MRLKELIELLNREFPFSLALSWDNSGLQVGDPEQEVNLVAVALDPVTEVIERATELGVHCIVTHHPLVFRPLKTITPDNPVGRVVTALIRKNMSLVSLHTNLDVAPGGLADYVAGLLGFEVEGPLFVEEGKELGRVCTTPSPLRFDALLGLVKESLGGGLRVVNPPAPESTRLWKVALCPGSGGDLVGRAAAVGAQLYITGDLKYHQAVEAREMGLTVIDAGHYGTERPAVELLANTLERLAGTHLSVVKVYTEDPFKEDLS